MDKIEELKRRLKDSLPDDPDDDGSYGTDGSHESLLEVFDRGYQAAYSVAIEAIRLLEGKIE